MEAFKQAESAPEMPLGLLMDGTQVTTYFSAASSNAVNFMQWRIK